MNWDAVERGDVEGGGHFGEGERGVFGEVLGAKIAGSVGVRQLRQGLNCRGHRRSDRGGEDAAIEVEGGADLGVVGEGGFKGGVRGVQQIGLVLIAGLKEEGDP